MKSQVSDWLNDIHYMSKVCGTITNHHFYMWVFPKLLPQMSLYDSAPVHTVRSMNDLARLEWKNSSGLQRALPRRMKVIITAKGGLSLEWSVQKAHMGVIARCPKTFGYIVYFKSAKTK